MMKRKKSYALTKQKEKRKRKNKMSKHIKEIH